MILVGGENLMDMIQIGAQNGNAMFEAVPGGSPYNLAMAIGRQDQTVGYLTPISEDANGQHLASHLTSSNVTLLADRVAAPTSLAMVSLEDGVPSYAFYREATAERQVTLSSISAHLNPEVSLFHIGSLALTGGEDADIWEAFAGHCKDQQIPLSLDPNVRASLISDPDSYRARLDRLLRRTDILKLSDEDIGWLYDEDDLSIAQSKLIKATSAPIIVLTKGGDGASFWHDGVWHDMPAIAVDKLEDTVGAGDTFMASMLVWLTENNHIEALDSLELDQKSAMVGYASKAAALNCMHKGCNPPRRNALD